MNFSGVYVVLVEGTSVSVAKTIAEVTAPADSAVTLLRAWVGQDVSETSEALVVGITTKSAAGAGTAFTPRKLNPRYAAAGSTARVADFTGEGTITEDLYREAFNILNGWLWLPVPEERITIAGGDIVGIRLRTAPAAALTISAGLVFAELG